MMKLFKRLKSIFASRQGMTLIEMVVTLALFALIASAVAFIFPPTYKSYRTSNALAETSTLMDTMSQYVLTDASRADSMEIKGDLLQIKTSQGNVSYYCYNGTDTSKEELLNTLCRDNDVPVREKRYYNSKQLKIGFFQSDGTTPMSDGIVNEAFLMRFTVLDNQGETLAVKDYAIYPLSLAYSKY